MDEPIPHVDREKRGSAGDIFICPEFKSERCHHFIMIWAIFDLFRKIDIMCMSDRKSEKQTI